MWLHGPETKKRVTHNSELSIPDETNPPYRDISYGKSYHEDLSATASRKLSATTIFKANLEILFVGSD